MQQTLNQTNTTISVGGNEINKLRFADDIDLIAGSNAEFQTLINTLVSASKEYGMEISTEKSKSIVNSVNIDDHANILMDGTQLEDVKTFKYLGSTLKYYSSSENEIRIQLATATLAMVRLDTIWRSKNIRFLIKFNLYKSIILSILLYGCKT